MRVMAAQVISVHRDQLLVRLVLDTTSADSWTGVDSTAVSVITNFFLDRQIRRRSDTPPPGTAHPESSPHASQRGCEDDRVPLQAVA
ncbi:hypothetical protein [Streptomyces sp. NPDC056817]|uniref:hypothetical protein n=1 Tax=Streptomyces sp. NPDC056817 TaxID=3345950 RepID=UPI00369D2D60